METASHHPIPATYQHASLEGNKEMLSKLEMELNLSDNPWCWKLNKYLLRIFSYVFINSFEFQPAENIVRKTFPVAELVLLLITHYWERSAGACKEFFVREDLLIFKRRGVGEMCVWIKVIVNLGDSMKLTELSAVRYWTSGLWSKKPFKYLPIVRLLNNLVAGSGIFYILEGVFQGLFEVET